MTSSNGQRPGNGTSQSGSRGEQTAMGARFVFPGYTALDMRNAFDSVLRRGGVVLSLPLRARQFWTDLLASMVEAATATYPTAVESDDDEELSSWVILPGPETTPTSGRATSEPQATTRNTNVDDAGAHVDPPDTSIEAETWQIVDARAHLPSEGALNGDGIYRRRASPGLTVDYAMDRVRYGVMGLGSAAEDLGGRVGGWGKWAITTLSSGGERWLGRAGSERSEEYELERLSSIRTRASGSQILHQEDDVDSEDDLDSEDDGGPE